MDTAAGDAHLDHPRRHARVVHGRCARRFGLGLSLRPAACAGGCKCVRTKPTGSARRARPAYGHIERDAQAPPHLIPRTSSVPRARRRPPPPGCRLCRGRRAARKLAPVAASAQRQPSASVGVAMLAASAAGARAPRCVASRVCNPHAAGAPPHARAVVGASLCRAAAHRGCRVLTCDAARARRRERPPRDDVAASSRCVHSAGARRGGTRAPKATYSERVTPWLAPPV
jgi:hypothetical protein